MYVCACVSVYTCICTYAIYIYALVHAVFCAESVALQARVLPRSSLMRCSTTVTSLEPLEVHLQALQIFTKIG